MSVELRLILFLGAFFMMVYFSKQVSKNKIEIQYSLFWIVFSFFLIIISIFPVLIIIPATWLGVESPANFLFSTLFFVLLIKEFQNTTKLSQIESKVVQLIQEIALNKEEKK